jgi:hypothetical protein
MEKTILLLGRTGIVVQDAQAQLNDESLKIITGTNIEEVRAVFKQVSSENRNIDHVFMGAGIDLDKRVEIVKEVFTLSNSTSVHLKDSTSGQKGFLPFVDSLLRGLKGHQ